MRGNALRTNMGGPRRAVFLTPSRNHGAVHCMEAMPTGAGMQIKIRGNGGGIGP
jgi:hypothetical protein